MGVGGIETMEDYQRYAIFWAPEAGSALGRWGAHWLGWCAEAGESRPQTRIDGLPRPIPELTAGPRRYGLHATLKAPFRMAERQSRWGLEQALEDFAARAASFPLPPLGVTVMGGFVALCPTRADPALARLAADCVTRFDGFRAPPAPEELARRRRHGLSAAQEANLVSWGYPWVMNEFRFHITLTGKLDTGTAEAAAACLQRELAPILARPMEVSEIALFGDPGGGMPFRLLNRFALTGDPAARDTVTFTARGPSYLTGTAGGS